MRIWDATAAVPDLRVTVPHDSGGAGPKLRAVSALKASYFLPHEEPYRAGRPPRKFP